MSAWISQIELQASLRPVQVPEPYTEALFLVRSGGKPLGWVSLDCRVHGRAYSPNALRQAALEQCGFEITREAFRRERLNDGATEQPGAPFSVVVCTRDRPEQLRACLAQLTRSDYACFEVVVVDNAPAADSTRDIAAQAEVRYVREDRPGLDWARNRGVAEARHELIAFVDDDARPDEGWLRALDRAFADSEVMAVTGLVLPAELDTPAQLYFERVYGGMGKGFLPRTLHRSGMEERRWLWASGFGVGANMAFRRSLFAAIGLFDVALDVGTASRGGGDVEFFHRVVARGRLLRYQPEAVVWHSHRREFVELRRQLFNNGCSVVPYLLTCLRNGTVSKSSAARFALRDILGWWLLRRCLRPGRHRRSLVLWELAGFLRGFLAYPQARRTAARLGSPPQQTVARPPEPMWGSSSEPGSSRRRCAHDDVSAL